MKRLDTDILVVGRGIAGLMTAWRATKHGADTLVTGLGAGASAWLQGCNLALGDADPRDDPRAHIADTLREGAGINDPDLVSDTVYRALDGFRELLALGVDFEQEGGRFSQRRAVGSTYARSCYVASVMWGGEAARLLTRALVEKGARFEGLQVVRLLNVDGAVAGAVAIDRRTREPVLIRAKVVVLANGGIGNLYGHSTYPKDVSGSAYAIAFHAGAALGDLEFIQFEPLVGRRPGAISGYAFPTTLLNEGAVLRDRHGKRFLFDFREEGEEGIGKEQLVRCIAMMGEQDRALDQSGVWLDATAVPPAKLFNYKWLNTFAKKHGLEMEKTPVDIWPAAHSCLGGVVVDRERRSTVPGLFAVGEAATGIHGAGRIGASSGTDVLASGAIVGHAATNAARARGEASPWWSLEEACGKEFDIDASPDDAAETDISRIAERRREILGTSAGIFRTGPSLKSGLASLEKLYAEVVPQARSHPASVRLGAADSLLVAGLVLDSALGREESRGAHLRRDFLDHDPKLGHSLRREWGKHGAFRV